MNRRSVLPGVVVCSLAACFQDHSTAAPAPSRILEHVSASFNEAPAGAVLAAPTVRLVEQGSRKPIPNVQIEFLLRPQSGSITNVVTRTDREGLASAGLWTLPVRAGEAVLDVDAGGLRISFVATVKPGEAVGLKVVDSTIAWIAGESAPGPVVMVVDRFGNPIDGALVTFTVVQGGGQLAKNETVTARGGRASPLSWMLGAIPGENLLTAQFAHAPGVTIRTLGLVRAGVAWYDLETVGGLPIPAGGIDRARLGLTKFDRCLCVDEAGYFMIDAMQSAGPLGPTALRIGISGRFRLQSQQIHLIGEAGESRASPEGDAVIYMVRDQARSMDNGRVRVDVSRWFPVSGVWSTLSWMFREGSQ